MSILASIRLRTLLASGACLIAMTACSDTRSAHTTPTVDATQETTATAPTIEPTTTPMAPTTPSTSEPPTSSTVPPEPDLPQSTFAGLVSRATDAGVPQAASAVVVASACFGDQGRSHWGYFNNGALGGAITERDGAIVPLDAICLNPSQPDAYSSLLHELGHRYMWHRGVWDSAAAEMGSLEHATECFAKAYGAITFGQGGCSSADAAHLMAWLGLSG